MARRISSLLAAILFVSSTWLSVSVAYMQQSNLHKTSDFTRVAIQAMTVNKAMKKFLSKSSLYSLRMSGGLKEGPVADKASTMADKVSQPHAKPILSLADGKQLYINKVGWACAEQSGFYTNTNQNRRSWSMDKEGHLWLPDGRQLFVNGRGRVCAALPNFKPLRSACTLHESGLLLHPDGRQVAIDNRGWARSGERNAFQKWTLEESGDLTLPDGKQLYVNVDGGWLCSALPNDFTNTEKNRRAWSKDDAGILSLADGRKIFLDDSGKAYVSFPDDLDNSNPALNKWRMDEDGTISLADGRQLYVDDKGWAYVAEEGVHCNTDPSRRIWTSFSDVDYDDKFSPAPDSDLGCLRCAMIDNAL